MTLVSVRNIEKVPERCGGSAVIRNTRIRVSVIAECHRQGMAVDEIVAAYPHLRTADIHDALAYAHEFPDEIAADIQFVGFPNVEPITHYSRAESSSREIGWQYYSLLPFVFAFAESFEDGETGFFGVGNRERFGRVERGPNTTNRLFAGRTVSQRRG